MTDGLEQRIVLFKEPLSESQTTASCVKITDFDSILARHHQQYGSSISHWKEIALVLLTPYMEALSGKYPVDPRRLYLDSTTSYEVLAAREGKAKHITPIGTNGLIRTADGYLLYGLRGGQVEAGQACIVPSGSISAKPEEASERFYTNPIFERFESEAATEAGLSSHELKNARLIGYVTDPGHTKSIQFVIAVDTHLTFDEIKQRHEAAYSVYAQKKRELTDTISENEADLQAREAISGAGFINTSAWEHTGLIGIKGDQLATIISSNQVSYNGKHYQLTNIGAGCLRLYQKLISR
ncbi:MAG TPA: hypothetical protein VFF28_05440 [Candidatus Nanoarchaeia archaeon]|nr:hypothetical protein [Candidatus Nanoarchaeia archaeon]